MKLALEPLRSSIRRWLLWVLSVSLTVVMVVNGWLQLLTIHEPIGAAFDHALLDDAYAVSAYVRATPQGITFELPPGAEDVLRTDPDDAFYFLVTGPRGEYVAGDRDLPIPANVLPGRDPIFEVSFRGEPVRGVLHLHPTELGNITVHVAQTLRARREIEAEVVAGLLVTKTALIGLTLLVVYLVVGAGLRPLLRLSRDIEARGSDVLAPVSQQDLPAELQPLARALNRLLAVIDGTTRAQRRFLADASHQLRTPLAGLQGQLELLSHEDLPDTVRGRVLALHEATRRLSHLSGRLLALGRSDALADPAMQMEPIDLGDVVEECASIFLDRALGKDLDLGFEAESARIVGCPWMIREMASNLVDNAICYTPARGRVTVRSRMLDACATLEVEDNGIGVEAPERERVFERFYRGRQDDGMGCGLGLAIVKQIAEAHGARVSILDPPSGQGSLFRVSFPPAHGGIEAPA
jgi:two-component system sensor histidine kinase TctE